MHALLPLLLLLSFGCVGTDGEPKVQPVCSETKPCPDGLVCDVGASAELTRCVPCARDRECARTEMCHPVQRRCVLRPCFGNQCDVHDDCGLGEFCVQGLCLRADENRADRCAVVGCADGEVCNEGQRCHAENLVCEEDLGCEQDGDCGETELCNTAAGQCEAACTGESAAAVCGVKRVCHDGRCADCVRDENCGAGLRCNLATHLCESLSSCQSSRDCEVPLVCHRVTHSCTVDPGPCISAEDCAVDETCQLSSGKCVSAHCAADRFEPNDTPGTAASAGVGSILRLTLCEGDMDHFRIALARGDRLRALVEADALMPFEIAILTPEGIVASTGELVTEATASVDGEWFVRAGSAAPHVPYALRLSISRGVPCDIDPEEPNNDYLHAAPVGPGDLFGRSVCPGDEDWFVLDEMRGQKLQVDLASTPLDGLLTLAVYDSDGTRQLARSATEQPVQTLSVRGFTGNRAYIRVGGATAATQNKYDLHIVRGP